MDSYQFIQTYDPISDAYIYTLIRDNIPIQSITVTAEFLAGCTKKECANVIINTFSPKFQDIVSEFVYKDLYGTDGFKYVKQHYAVGGKLSLSEFSKACKEASTAMNKLTFVAKQQMKKGGFVGNSDKLWKKYLEAKKKVDSQYSSIYFGNNNVSKVDKLPGVDAIVMHPIEGHKGTIQDIIIDLNDDYEWSREKIADWLDSIDGKDGIDLTFKSRLDSKD